MAADTKIEWTDHTFNAWVGCTKVSPACDHCYAEDWSKRYGRAKWGPGEARQRTAPANWRQPLKWNAEAEAAGVKRFVFCNSLSDVFDNEVPDEWRGDLWDLIVDTIPALKWLLLTKRIGNVEKMVADLSDRWPWPRNAWLGITVVNQEEADRDIPKLLAAKAALKIPRVFLSIEPMLGPVDLTKIPHRTVFEDGFLNALTGLIYYDRGNGAKGFTYTPFGMDIDWVICGGESGKSARPMHPDWARSLRDQCAGAGVPFFFKQWGEWSSQHLLSIKESYCFPGEPFVRTWRVGKARAGRLLDGVEHNGRPAA